MCSVIMLILSWTIFTSKHNTFLNIYYSPFLSRAIKIKVGAKLENHILDPYISPPPCFIKCICRHLRAMVKNKCLRVVTMETKVCVSGECTQPADSMRRQQMEKPWLMHTVSWITLIVRSKHGINMLDNSRLNVLLTQIILITMTSLLLFL